MFKKTITLFFVISIFFTMTRSFADAHTFDLSNLDKSVITINYTVKSDVKTKLMIESNDTKYYYDLLSSSQTFPLQFGNGTYSAAIFEQQANGKYIHIKSLSFELKLENHDTVYLSSNEIVSWEIDSISTILAHEITKNLTTDTEKVNAIHDYIIKNIKYDEGKINSLDSTYIPNLDYIISSKSGICYDYASLFAAMSRSLNIPTKLVKGYKNDISSYHAWNQVFLNDEWITIDATYNATLFDNQFETTLIMNDHDYSIKKTY